jgi:hypothetical protein
LVKDAQDRLGKFARAIDRMKPADEASYSDCRKLIERLMVKINTWGLHADDPF